MTIHIFPAPPSIRGDAQPLKFNEAARYRAAALRARQLYPNCLGELVHRELTAFAEFGYHFAGDSLMSRLAAEILGLDADAGEAPRASPEGPGTPGLHR